MPGVLSCCALNANSYALGGWYVENFTQGGVAPKVRLVCGTEEDWGLVEDQDGQDRKVIDTDEGQHPDILRKERLDVGKQVEALDEEANVDHVRKAEAVELDY